MKTLQGFVVGAALAASMLVTSACGAWATDSAAAHQESRVQRAAVRVSGQPGTARRARPQQRWLKKQFDVNASASRPRTRTGRGAAPNNDMFAARYALSGEEGMTNGSNVDATIEAGESTVNYDGTQTVWWTWTAPAAGTYAFDTYGSDFDTVLAIWQGTAPASLTLVGVNDDNDTLQSFFPFAATSGGVYQIQVNGYNESKIGIITLNWARVTWTNQYTTTNVENEVWLTSKGTALQRANYSIRTEYWGTDSMARAVYYDWYVYPLGSASVADKKGNKVVDHQAFPGAPVEAWIEDFDGTQVLLGNEAQAYNEVFLYKVAKGSFALVGTAVISNDYDKAWFTPGGIFVQWAATTMEGLQCWHKKLKKLLWQLPLAPGWFEDIYDNGFSFFATEAGGNTEYTVYKKNKIMGANTLSNAFEKIRTDEKGGLLYWSAAAGTNGPMTLVTPHGKKVFENFTPDGFTTYAMCLYNSKQLWFRKGNYGGTVELRSYKPASTPVLNGSTTVANYDSGGIRGATSYSVSDAGGVFTLRGHNKKLAEQWSQAHAGAYWEYFDKDVYYIYEDTGTADAYYMYKKDKELCTHSYPYP